MNRYQIEKWFHLCIQVIIDEIRAYYLFYVSANTKMLNGVTIDKKKYVKSNPIYAYSNLIDCAWFE